MSTKIFPFKTRKIKPPKPPDTALAAAWTEAQEREHRRQAMRQQDRRTMAELRAEDLARRAALVVVAAKKEIDRMALGETFAMRCLRRNNKAVKTIFDTWYFYKTLPDKVFRPIINTIVDATLEEAKRNGLLLTEKEVRDCVDYAIMTFVDETKKTREADRIIKRGQTTQKAK